MRTIVGRRQEETGEDDERNGWIYKGRHTGLIGWLVINEYNKIDML